MEVIGVAANAIAVIDLSVKVGTLCLKYAKDVKNANADIARLREEVASLQGVTEKVQQLVKGSNGKKVNSSNSLDDVLKHSRTYLRDLNQKLRPKAAQKAIRRFGLRALKWPFKHEEVETLIEGLRRYNDTISHVLQVYQTEILYEVDDNVKQIDQHLVKVDQKTVLNSLPTAAGASYDSHEEQHNAACLPNTRVDLLEHIQAWASDPSSKVLFWLNGMAGTGKSTISRTTCQRFAESRQLGASFFFKRGEADRGGLSRFVTTIAAQLAGFHPEIAPHIKSAIDVDPSISSKTTREQFDKLIRQPLSILPKSFGEALSLVFVIDALDECDQDEDVKLIISLFSSCAEDVNLNMKLKCLITSRPELPIRFGFNAAKGTFQDLILHEIPPSIIEHDIAAFLEHELARIRTEYNESVPTSRQLPTNWPGQQNIQLLVKMAIPLFIFAATTCRFLNDRRSGDPDMQLREIIDFQAENQASHLDATYLPVLNRLISGLPTRRRNGAIQRFRAIVGSIVILESPLSKTALGALLDVPKNVIHQELDLLHSVLSVPQSDNRPVRLLHLSFRDFLVDPEKQGEIPFWVDEKDTHKTMAANCLRVMKKNLVQDICGLVLPGTRRSDIKDQAIQVNMPPELQYACLYWVSHIQQGDVVVDDVGEILEFMRSHFLHWLEALSLIGRASESLKIIKALKLVLTLEGSQELRSFLQDALWLIQANVSAIDATPLQIYSSVIAFAPNSSPVRQAFQNHIPDWMSLPPEPEDHWGQCRQIIEGLASQVNSVAYSPDGTIMASASDDCKIRLWRSVDGVCVQELKGHKVSTNSVVFSPDGTLIASASGDYTTRIWRIDDGTCVHELKGHKTWVNSVAFSPDGALVASGSGDYTVRLWRVDDGTCVQELKGHASRVNSLVFSPDAKVVASASGDHTVRLWRHDDGTCIHELKGHVGRVNSVAFSPDGTHVASASGDHTIKLWRSSDGTCVQELKGHAARVNSVAFSPDGKVIASGSGDHTLRLWRIDNGSCVQEFKGHGGRVNSVAFSPDGAILASAAADCTVRFWSSDNGNGMREVKGHGDRVSLATVSPDGKLIASAADDHTVRVWSADDATCVQNLQSNGDRVVSVFFASHGLVVASASQDCIISLLQSDKSDEGVKKLKGHRGRINSVALSSNGALVASGSNDHTIRLWHRDNGAFVKELKGHAARVNSVAFSPDSTVVASASGDHTVRLWRTNDGVCFLELKGHTGKVVSSISTIVGGVAFSNEMTKGYQSLNSSFGNDLTPNIPRHRAATSVTMVHELPEAHRILVEAV
ncbi:uncharacterized protein BROUX77_001847 [Berkeleyomyces rouxiae]|uniref:uncharacterized protein n=1 Tax=Berkeleyomyces rouxiae TaxID=2035830 RepID=UPI003B82AAAF